VGVRRRRLWSNWFGVLALIVVCQLSLAMPAKATVNLSDTLRAESTRFVQNASGDMRGSVESANSSSSSSVFDNEGRVYATLGFGLAAACAVLLLVRRSLMVHGSSDNRPPARLEQAPDRPTAGVGAAPAIPEEAPVTEGLDHLQTPSRRRSSFIGEGWGPIVVAIVLASVTAALDFGGALTGEGTATILGALVGYVVAKGHSG
jgi:hypothetical protein